MVGLWRMFWLMCHELDSFTWGAGQTSTPAANTTGTSNALNCERFREKTIQVTNPAGAGAFSVDIEGTLDGNKWGKLVTGVTVDGSIQTINAAVTDVRLNVTASSGGATPSAFFAGFDSRTDGG